MAKRYSNAGLSKNLTYTVIEIHDITGISPQTTLKRIRNKELPAMTAKKPFLIHGEDLIAFNNAKRNQGKKPLEPGTFRCFSCGARERPFGNMADYIPSEPRSRLSALCGTCERPVSLIVGKAKLEQYGEILDIANTCPL